MGTLLGKDAVGEQANPTPAADPALPGRHPRCRVVVFPGPPGAVAADGLAAGAELGLRGLFCCVASWKGSSGTPRGPLLLLQRVRAPVPNARSSASFSTWEMAPGAMGRSWEHAAPGPQGTAQSQPSSGPGSPRLPPALAARARMALVPPAPGGPGHREIPVTGIRAAFVHLQLHPSRHRWGISRAERWMSAGHREEQQPSVDKAMPKAPSLLFLPSAAPAEAALLSARWRLLRSSASRCRGLDARSDR